VSSTLSRYFCVALLAGLSLHCGTEGGTIIPEDPAIELSEESVRFSATATGTPPASQTVVVTNGGEGALSELSASVAYTEGQPADWLNVSLAPTTAPSTLTLNVSPPAFAQGSLTAAVVVASEVASNSPQTLTVTLTIASSGDPNP
jgi:hypothetical protein